MSKIGIVGGGWYGCHLALALSKEHEVTLFEKNPSIFTGISGEFGIRLHAGPHYPRSAKTRKSCRRAFAEFQQRYPDLIVPHEYSIYALGKSDSDGNPSKVNADTFRKVCEETKTSREIDPEKRGYKDLISAFDIEEPSIVLGKKLRTSFKNRLKNADVKVVLDYDVTKITSSKGNKPTIVGKTSSQEFDMVINATSYQTLLQPLDDFPFEMEVVYQPCLALVYKDKKAGSRPISFIVMDGWYPCLMPTVDEFSQGTYSTDKYILTHGKWTIMGSYANPKDAKNVFHSLQDDFVNQTIRKYSEQEMNRFWPEFSQRFDYIGWKGSVIAKIKTRKEFRNAVTYEKDGVIQIIPGKVSGIFDVEQEVRSLLSGKSVLQRKGYRYAKGGVLDCSESEIIEKPNENEPNTCTLQTYQELMEKELVPKASEPVMAASPPTFFAKPKLPPKPSSPIVKNIEKVETNTSYFELQVLAGLVGGLSILAITLIALPLIGFAMAAMSGSAAIIGAGYLTYSLFAEPKILPDIIKQSRAQPELNPIQCGLGS